VGKKLGKEGIKKAREEDQKATCGLKDKGKKRGNFHVRSVREFPRGLSGELLKGSWRTQWKFAFTAEAQEGAIIRRGLALQGFKAMGGGKSINQRRMRAIKRIEC